MVGIFLKPEIHEITMGKWIVLVENDQNTGDQKWRKLTKNGLKMVIKVSKNSVRPLEMPRRCRIIPFCGQGCMGNCFRAWGHPSNNNSHFKAVSTIFDHFCPFLTIFEPNLAILPKTPIFPILISWISRQKKKSRPCRIEIFQKFFRFWTSP